MPKEKAAIFVDNSNIFRGMHQFSGRLIKRGDLKERRYLRMRWDKLIEMLEVQDDGLDIYARHFFASLPPAADVRKLTGRPTEEEWQNMIKESAQTGFYKLIRQPPFCFELHAVPLRFAEVYCRSKTKQAFYRCRDAQGGEIGCSLSLDLDECYDCKRKFLWKYEKGVDVALAVQLVISGAMASSPLERVILVAGDGDYKEAVKYLRRQAGKDVQIVSWETPLSRDLRNLANKDTIILDDCWKMVCEVRTKAPLEETPADFDESAQEAEE